MDVTLKQMDFFIIILVRVASFVSAAPFYSMKQVPMKAKAIFSLALTMLLFATIPSDMFSYESNFDFIILIVKEAMVGMIIGFFANMGYYILSLVGHMMDTEIGFAMVNTLDPVTSIQVTITSNLYSYLIMLMMMITNLHHYFIRAFVDSYQVIPVGGGKIPTNLYELMLAFLVQYFIIAFRIVLPVFGSILIVNVTLGILAKVAPQMNMFVIGMQLKVLVGLLILYVVIQLLPAVSDFVFNQMIESMRQAIYSMGG